MKSFVLLLAALLLAFPSLAAEAPPEQALTRMRPQLSDHILRPLRYAPVDGDFVITNGAEYFNRPLYCLNSAFRIDGGDQPEFSLYVPGRGGNLRLGIRTAAGIKWLNDAETVVMRYHAGSLVYTIRDSLLGEGELELAVLPLSETKGLVARVELSGSRAPMQLILAFGGANGMRGKRGGDIGCESQPVTQFFQLRPDECRGDEFRFATNQFVLQGKSATIAGIFPVGARWQLADARNWNAPAELFSGTTTNSEFPVATGEMPLPPGRPVFFALEQISAAPDISAEELPKLFPLARQHCREIAGRVTVETPDAFINAAVPALNVAADAIWDARQHAYMHGAVAWRQRLLGWRGPYVGDALGDHGRTAEHFIGFAGEQNVGPVPSTIPPADENANLARSEAALHSNGDLTKAHYDMNLVAVDAFFRHLRWTGDLAFARTNWPVIERHFAWERRLFRREFGPDRLPLYEAYAAIWASDNLSYNGGGTAHASAYNYYANQMAARVAPLIGKNPEPYEHEAELISRAMQKYLWLTNDETFAEYRDYLGRQLAHPAAGLWTFYNTVDSEVPTAAEAWQMSHWIDRNIAHLPVTADGRYFVLPESSWMPYEWSLNNVVVAENMHTALADWEANRPETAFALFKGTVLDTMFQGLCPGNVGAMMWQDAARGEAQRDFGDGIGITARALVEGLFGVRPDVLDGELKIVPGFPADWAFAKMHHPDFDFEFHREGPAETYSVESKFARPMKLDLRIPGTAEDIESVTVNGKPATWSAVAGIFGTPRLEISAGAAGTWKVIVQLRSNAVAEGPGVRQPSAALSADWPPKSHFNQALSPSFNWSEPLPENARFDTVDLEPFFNDRVTQIFRNDYRSPRSPFCSLALPKQGIGGWADNNQRFDVDDSGLRAVAGEHGGKIVLPDGVPFATPTHADRNIIFTSQWDNYPRAVTVPLSGKARRAFLLLAGSTDPMESQFVNGEVVVSYDDGTTAELPLRNPDNWWPIDQDYFVDDYAFRLDAPLPPRIDLATGRVRLPEAATFKGAGGPVRGGAATVLELPLDPGKELKSLTVRAVANEVVIGLMSVTLERE